MPSNCPGSTPQGCHALHDLPRTQPGINQHMRAATAYQRGISTTATAEHSHANAACVHLLAFSESVQFTENPVGFLQELDSGLHDLA
jgi:hypothetical protein